MKAAVMEADEKQRQHRERVETEPGEPGRTPGSAEGERREIEEALGETPSDPGDG